MEVYRRSSGLLLLLGFALLATTLQGVQGEVEAEGPSESECRPYIEKALKELEAGDVVVGSSEAVDDSKEDIPTVEITDDSEHQDGEGDDNDSNEDGQDSKESKESVQETISETKSEPEVRQTVIQIIANKISNFFQRTPVNKTKEAAIEEKTDDKEADDSQEQTVQASAEDDTKSDETDNKDESDEKGDENEDVETTADEKESEEGDDKDEAAEDGDQDESNEQEEAEDTKESVEETANESIEEPLEAKAEAESQEEAGESEEKVTEQSAEDKAESEEKAVDEESEEQEAENVQTAEESKEQAESKEDADQGDSKEDGDQGDSKEEPTHGDSQETAEQTEDKEEPEEADSKEEPEQAEEEPSESVEESVPNVELPDEDVEEPSEDQQDDSQDDENSKEEATGQESTEEQAESIEQKEESKEESAGDQTEAGDSQEDKQDSVEDDKKDSGEDKDDTEEDKTDSKEDIGDDGTASKEDEKSEENKSIEKREAGDEPDNEDSVEKVDESEEEKRSVHDDDDESEESTQSTEGDAGPVEELSGDIEIPSELRSRDHVEHLLKLDEESSETENVINKVNEITLKELKKLYENAIKPLETLYKYRDLSNRHFGDSEIFSKPLILFMGPWSGGKSSIINYLVNIEYNETALRTGAEPSPAYFNILVHGDEPEVLDGTELAADFTFSGLQKFGQGLEERLRGLKVPSKILEKVNIVEIPGILEVRKQVSRVFPFNDACQWFIDRADIIFLVYDPSKLDVGPETEAILDQLKGREHQTRIVLNKADQVKPEELMRVQGALIWNISPLMSSPQPPVMYTTSLWSRPFETWAPTKLLQAQERAFLRDLRGAIEKRIENKIASARRFAVRVRNHAKMVDCYLTTYYNHKSVFGNRKQVADEIIDHPQDYHIYEGLSTLTNISRYDLPDPDVYRDFFKLNPLYEFQQLSATCTYFRGCPINRLDIAIAYDLPELVGTHKKLIENALTGAANQSPSTPGS